MITASFNWLMEAEVLAANPNAEAARTLEITNSGATHWCSPPMTPKRRPHATGCWIATISPLERIGDSGLLRSAASIACSSETCQSCRVSQADGVAGWQAGVAPAGATYAPFLICTWKKQGTVVGLPWVKVNGGANPPRVSPCMA